MLSGKISEETTLCQCPPSIGRYHQAACVSIRMPSADFRNPVLLYTNIQYLFIICVHCTLVLADILQIEYKGGWIELSSMIAAVAGSWCWQQLVGYEVVGVLGSQSKLTSQSFSNPQVS